MKHCPMFSREIFYVTDVLYLNILWLKAVNTITARQTRTSFAKLKKGCSIRHLTTQIELVLPTYKSWTVHKFIEYFTLGLLSSLWNIYHSTTAYFFTHPVGTTHKIRITSYSATKVSNLLKLNYKRIEQAHTHARTDRRTTRKHDASSPIYRMGERQNKQKELHKYIMR